MIADKLKEIRKDRNRTQGEVAEALGISQRVISKWELGQSEPDGSFLAKLAMYFKVSIEYFIDEKIELPKDPVREAIVKLQEMGLLKNPDVISEVEKNFILDAVRQDLRMQQLKKQLEAEEIKKQEV